jgi:predicted nucleic acid-binding Zn ribbon protein
MTLHRRAPRSIAGALTPLRDGWAPETVLAEAQRVWVDAVGAAIAAEAQPISERAGVLTVACENAAWAHELDLMAPSLLDRVNERLARGRITRLRCVSGGSQRSRF